MIFLSLAIFIFKLQFHINPNSLYIGIGSADPNLSTGRSQGTLQRYRSESSQSCPFHGRLVLVSHLFHLLVEKTDSVRTKDFLSFFLFLCNFFLWFLFFLPFFLLRFRLISFPFHPPPHSFLPPPASISSGSLNLAPTKLFFP